MSDEGNSGNLPDRQEPADALHRRDFFQQAAISAGGLLLLAKQGNAAEVSPNKPAVELLGINGASRNKITARVRSLTPSDLSRLAGVDPDHVRLGGLTVGDLKSLTDTLFESMPANTPVVRGGNKADSGPCVAYCCCCPSSAA